MSGDSRDYHRSSRNDQLPPLRDILGDALDKPLRSPYRFDLQNVNHALPGSSRLPQYPIPSRSYLPERGPTLPPILQVFSGESGAYRRSDPQLSSEHTARDRHYRHRESSPIPAAGYTNGRHHSHRQRSPGPPTGGYPTQDRRPFRRESTPPSPPTRYVVARDGGGGDGDDHNGTTSPTPSAEHPQSRKSSTERSPVPPPLSASQKLQSHDPPEEPFSIYGTQSGSTNPQPSVGPSAYLYNVLRAQQGDLVDVRTPSARAQGILRPTAIIEDEDDSHKRYHCDWPGCDKKYDRPSSLDVHRNTHTGSQPYPCQFEGCKRAFNVKSNMLRHFRSHPQTTRIPAKKKKTYTAVNDSRSDGDDDEGMWPEPAASSRHFHDTPSVPAVLSSNVAQESPGKTVPTSDLSSSTKQCTSIRSL